ncbi:MAG: hypothetical protein COB92_06135 [Robiginitomaculum sp.]|nr:MAG: hypothetical protein COB92_06135 [Robiginitomaculum sp.]
MLCNIIDSRKKTYRWAKLNAVIENTSHDNGVTNSDYREEPSRGGITYEDKIGVSLNEAIVWAEKQKFPVTLFLYDEGDGIE